MELAILIPIPVLFVAAIISLGTLPRVHRKEQCAACGYSRAGLGNQPNCPECGHVHGSVTDHSLRKVAVSGSHENWLIVVPVLLCSAGAAAMLPAAYAHMSIIGAIALLLLGTLCSLPGALLGWLAAGRTTIAVAWTICLSGAIPTAGFGAWVGVNYLLAPDRTYAMFGFLTLVFAGGVSAGLSGLVGCVAAAHQHRRFKQLQRDRARSNSRNSAPA